MSFHVGCHLSASKGYFHMGKTAKEIGADTFQFFTRNPRGGKARDQDEFDVKKYLDFARENGFGKIVAHAPYTVNPSSGNEKTREFARMTIKDDLLRLSLLPGNYYNLHPGNHTGAGVCAGIELTAGIFNDILDESCETTVLFETMSGKGSEVGATFGELKRLMDKIKLNEKIGICLDTCHISDAGYDIINDLDGVLGEFDKTIGLDRLHAVHVNDSKNPPGSRKDRHEKLGEGFLGKEAILNLVYHPKLKGRLFILETPNELEGYQREIELIRSAG